MPNNGLIVSGNLGVGTLSNINGLDVTGSVAIGSYGGINTAPTNGLIVSGRAMFGISSTLGGSNPLEVNKAISIGDGAAATTGLLTIVSTGGFNYIESGLTATFGSAASLFFTSMFAGTVWANIGSTGGFSVGYGPIAAPANGLIVSARAGIGNSSPQAPLHVVGAAGVRTDYGIAVISTGTSGDGGLSIGFDATNKWAWLYSRINGDNGYRINLNDTMFVSPFGTSGATTVTINTSAPAVTGIPLYVAGSSVQSFSGYGYLNSIGATGFHAGSSGSIGVAIWANDGRIIANAEFDALSDQRIKKNIQDISLEKAYCFVKKINPVSFEWKRRAGSNFGYLAQNVVKDFGHIYNLVEDKEVEEEIEEDGFVNPKGAIFTLSYDQAIPLLHKVILDLVNRVESLEQNKG